MATHRGPGRMRKSHIAQACALGLNISGTHIEFRYLLDPEGIPFNLVMPKGKGLRDLLLLVKPESAGPRVGVRNTYMQDK